MFISFIFALLFLNLQANALEIRQAKGKSVYEIIRSESEKNLKLKEKDYQAAFAKIFAEYQLEVVAPSKTRCDILTPNYAIEVDYAKKWHEAIGQALDYSAQFKRIGGIVLIIKDDKEFTYLQRLEETILAHKLPIKIWIILDIM